MDDLVGVPDEIREAGSLIKTLMSKPVQSRLDKELIQQAKLKIAYWACGSERIASTRDNLSFVLGSDAKEIMENYDKALEREETKEKEKGKDKTKKDTSKRGSKFWGGADT
jgi:hypothetical protein